MRAQVEYSACREAQTQDETFLLRLFRESQQGLIAMLGAAAEPLIEMQYRGRAASYAERYPAAKNLILLDSEAQPVGRLLLDGQPGCWRVVDIAVIAERQGRGIGGAALRDCQRQAAQAGARMALQVAPGNPAIELYQRLGFRVARQDAAGIEMVWALTFHE